MIVYVHSHMHTKHVYVLAHCINGNMSFRAPLFFATLTDAEHIMNAN